jgi:hypothetical protein
MSIAKKRSPWQLYNLVALVIMVLMNILANALPINGLTTAQVSDSLPNLFTPIGFTFAIWGVIYTLLTLFTAFQSGWLPGTRVKGRKTARAVGPWFVISSIANSLWIVAWHYQQIVLTVPIMLVILGSLIAIHKRLRQSEAPPLARIAFSVYLGWISVATIANVTGALVSVGWDAMGISHVTWTLIVLAVAGVIGVLFLKLYRDIYFNLVLVWALFGILMQHFTYHARSYWTIIGLSGGIMALLLFGIINVIFDSREPLYLEDEDEA